MIISAILQWNSSNLKFWYCKFNKKYINNNNNSNVFTLFNLLCKFVI